MWQRDGCLVCDGCKAAVDWTGMPRVVVMARARAMGWHCFEGFNVAGDKIIASHVCSDCMGTARSKLPPSPDPMAEDVPLFELEEKHDQPVGEQHHKGHRRI